ncbi:phage pre-neck appendage-like protein [Clostridium perfringens]|uniref:hypothetical protein n=1 Tax=Clostridium perfringens TaxID=1502 RepID=UPI000E14B2DA|nr:hypothetical protein [Clostridium perfringens]SUY33356.1 phage pre-neck appendage-like protein [Clostridium perfringens]
MLNKLYLDLNNFKPNLGSIERGDSIELNIKLLDNEDYSRSKFRVLGTKGDGKYVEQIEGINLEEKDLKVILEDQFVNCEGIVKLELNVVSGETEITTKEFYFFVSNTMNASIIDSADSLPTLEKVSKYVDDAVDNLEALKEASADITIINSEFKENEIKRKANELLRERSEKERVRLESIRTAEEADRIKAEAERKEAENNRKVAESNRKLAENTRKTNEAARVEAELNRQSLFEENEEIRNFNENLRIEAEKERKLTFSNNNKFESERVEAEKLRAIAEDKRVTAEKARANAEEERIKAETRRENTYTDFNDSEVERKNNEANRVRAEAERVNAESGRNELFNTNEEKRNSTFIESERTRERAFNEAQSNRNEAYEESERVREEAFKVSEVARNEAEEGRVAAELLRVEAEKLRVAGEENRNTTFTQSEEERKTTFEEAENTRKVAESKRVKAESSRVEAEKLRVTGETGRVKAESLRVTAEEERVAAETKREEGFNKFDGKINANTKELKNARTATTGEKFNSLDERIDCEVDRLNKKIEVSFLQQEDKESHTIENTVEGMTTDMIVKGRTLINMVKLGSVSNVIGIAYDTLAIYSYMYNLKNDTDYTIIFEIENKTDNNQVRISLNNGNKGQGFDVKNGINIIKIRSNAEKNNKLMFYYGSEYSGNGTVKNVILLESDWTNKSIPEYFESIKSFGQQEDRISILSHGKNLFDGNIEVGAWKDVGSLENAKYDISTLVRNTNPIKIKPNTQYIMNVDFAIRVNFYDKQGNLILQKSPLIENRKFISPPNSYYLCFNTSTQSTLNDVLNFKYQLEYGEVSTKYQKYISNKKDILLQDLGFDEGLRGLGNAQDEINSIKDMAIKKIEKYNFIGNEHIVVHNMRDNTIPFTLYFNSGFLRGKNNNVNFLCNSIITTSLCYSKDVEGVFGTSDGIYGAISKTKLESNDSEGVKKYLRNILKECYYELAEPVETPLSENINLKTFGEKTYVSFENSISGTSSFKAPVDSVATISRLNRENRALEEENRSLRQDFESTTLTLTDSDLELVKQNVDIDFRLMEVEFALDIPQSTLSSNINFKKKGEVKSMARTPYAMMKIVILSGDYDREDYIHKVGKYYERGRMTKEEYDELMSLMTADEVLSK